MNDDPRLRVVELLAAVGEGQVLVAEVYTREQRQLGVQGQEGSILTRQH